MSDVSSCPPVELGQERVPGVPDQQDSPLEVRDGGLAVLVGLDGDDGAVGDALGGEAVLEEGVVLVDAARQNA